MSFVDDLATGRHGLVVALPPHLVMTEKTPTSVTLRDPETGLGWWFSFFAGAHLDLSIAHAASLERSIQRHTRSLIEVERTEVVGGAALTILHRMDDPLIHEAIMGHTLVPVRGGLFEARWLGVAPRAGTAVLSIARAAKSWHLEADLQIKRPPAAPDRALVLAPFPYAVTVPPRFVRHGASTTGGDHTYVLRRLSYAGPDGVEHMLIVRTAERIRGLAVTHRLLRYATRRTHELAARAQLTGATCDATRLDEPLPAVHAVVEADPRAEGCARRRMVWRWFLDDAGHAWALAIDTTTAVPIDAVAHELFDVARSGHRV